MDIFDRIARDSGGPLGQYRQKAFGYYMYPKLEGELGPHMKFRGKDVLCWSLNNYLGLANHPEVRKADAEAADLVQGVDNAWERDRLDPDDTVAVEQKRLWKHCRGDNQK